LPTAGPSPTPFSHIVRANETLLSIASRYGLTLDALQAANPGINPRLLSIGQTLVIPGPEGTPDPLAAAVATPVPLSLSGVRCFRLVTGTTSCLLAARSPATRPPIEGMVALVTLLDGSGKPVATQPAYPVLNRLEPGGTVVLVADFPSEVDSWIQAEAGLDTAFEADPTDERFVDVVVTRATQDPASDRRSWRVAGEARLAGAPASGGARVTLVLVALDSAGEVAGYAVWEPDTPLSASEGTPFDITVYSLGPEIAETILLTEAQLPATATP
jgi:LysM repeat protein